MLPIEEAILFPTKLLADARALSAVLILLAGCSDVSVAPTCDDSLTRCNDNNPCTFDDCDAATGECLYANAADGTACESDGAASTCTSGVCDLSAEALAFCEDYSDICGFGEAGRYASESDCRSSYESFSTEKQGCVEQHLGFASASDPDLHCPHATGIGPCDI